MAGGDVVKKPVNVFKLGDLGEPSGVFNWRLWFAVFSFGLMGAARGIDEGLISGAFQSKDFQRYIHLDSYSSVERANIKANVSAMVQIGCVAGALVYVSPTSATKGVARRLMNQPLDSAFLVCDKIGRIWATRQLCALWIVGIAIFMANGGHLAAIYAGRFVAGIGIGQTAVVGPVYLVEIAPASVRGLCTCIFSGFVYLGIVIAYFANYGCSVSLGDATHARWLVPISVHLLFAGVILVLSLFQCESPRFLVKVGRHEAAARAMARLRGQAPDSEYVAREVQAIRLAHEHELEHTGASFVGTCKELFLDGRNLYRLYLATMVHVLAQWSGAGSITLYAPDLFKILGVQGSETGLLVTCLFGIVKLVSAIVCALFLIEVIGRKRALVGGIALQAIAMAYIAAFLTAVPHPTGSSAAARAAMAMIYVSGIGWSLGFNTISYVLTAEIFPLRVRALAGSIAMTAHFVCQYGSTRATPNMLLPASEGGIGPGNTFWCYGAILVVGGVWVVVSVPETAGRSLESMDRLFDLPWYKIGLKGNQDAAMQDVACDEKAGVISNTEGKVGHVEDRLTRTMSA
ncbi:General substrate transporter [Cordyceps fumosorosea ARSEF 2679]|uniref:General substrate transporter n=1 Tax=Cordyceps fumosorosea (strain ARSEF 2679) TaxID=1081104 RepID=A0A167S8K4_CORFA|nr:General substrate transporter [Cordyceps fumosorosea ARSEF 2679]OAA59368.1 General substrate transporter [Cordyceps fumosorosea ARSEF 2679]